MGVVNGLDDPLLNFQHTLRTWRKYYIPPSQGDVPKAVAREQRRWERCRMAWKARQAGLTYREIGEFLGVSGARTRQMTFEFERKLSRQWKRSPVEAYSATPAWAELR